MRADPVPVEVLVALSLFVLGAATVLTHSRGALWVARWWRVWRVPLDLGSLQIAYIAFGAMEVCISLWVAAGGMSWQGGRSFGLADWVPILVGAAGLIGCGPLSRATVRAAQRLRLQPAGAGPVAAGYILGFLAAIIVGASLVITQPGR